MVETILKLLEYVTKGLSCHIGPHHNRSPGPSAANYAVIDGPLNQVWLLWMVRFAASGPLVASRLKVEKQQLEILTEEVIIYRNT